MGDQLGEINNDVNDDLASNNTLKDEIRSIFTGYRAIANPTGPAVISNEPAEVQKSSVTTAAQRQLPFSKMQQRLYTMQEGLYFKNQRTAIRNRRSSR